MKFGKTAHPEHIDFSLPAVHPDTWSMMANPGSSIPRAGIFVGCAKWTRKDLPGFYPAGTHDELSYYATQFNSIELNATFYRLPTSFQIQKWYDATPAEFQFFPKVIRHISHLRRLNDKAFPILQDMLSVLPGFREKLGTVFMQMPPNYSPKEWDKFQKFVKNWPQTYPLTVEFRHTDWFHTTAISDKLYELLQENGTGTILVDTPGRRDLLHMRLSNDEAFVRFVAANHPLDLARLDSWISRLQEWWNAGLRRICFFIHQDITAESPLLASYFIEGLNARLGTDLIIPSKEEIP